mgnify:CR=1 FL=1
MRRSFVLVLAGLLVACVEPSPPDGSAPADLEPVAAADPDGPSAQDTHGATTPMASEGDRPASQYTYTRPMKGGYAQEAPDRSILEDPLHPREAMDLARSTLQAWRAQNTEPRVLLAGLGHHGTPLQAESPHEEDVPPDTPYVMLDLEATRGPVQHWYFCKQVLEMCARASGTMSGCVEYAVSCETPEPWESGEDCCPRQCLDDYSDRRSDGMSAQEAHFQTFDVDVPTCNGAIIELAQAAAEMNANALVAPPAEEGSP